MNTIHVSLISALILLASGTAGADPSMLPVHVGTQFGDHVEWRSTYTRSEPRRAAPDVWRLELAMGLPPGSTVTAVADRSADGEPEVQTEVDAMGRIVAVDIRGTDAFPVLLTTIPVGSSIDPPLALGLVQRIELDGVRLKPGPQSPLQSHLLDIRHVAVGPEDVRAFAALDRQTSAKPVYVLPDAAYVRSGGLASITERFDESRQGNFVTMSGFLGLALLLLAAGVRRGWRHAKVEAAEAYIASLPDEIRDELG